MPVVPTAPQRRFVYREGEVVLARMAATGLLWPAAVENPLGVPRGMRVERWGSEADRRINPRKVYLVRFIFDTVPVSYAWSAWDALQPFSAEAWHTQLAE